MEGAGRGNQGIHRPVGSLRVPGQYSAVSAGYLALRFHLTALGVGTDLAVLDERYLFAGAKFLVYLVSSVPTVALVVLVLVAVVALPGWLVSRVIGARGRKTVGRWRANTLAWWRVPTRLAVLGGEGKRDVPEQNPGRRHGEPQAGDSATRPGAEDGIDRL